ncbi:MAG: hypothetical protein ACOVO2_21420 [Emticicia sp.]|uniref:hypothetical protein n=1 Tax=Emticicia sp. TaxID=1930953 RepID=UPI003BA57503
MKRYCIFIILLLTTKTINAQETESKYFLVGSLGYSSTSNYTYRSNNKSILTKSENKFFKFTPSIFRKTKRRNFREFELSNLWYNSFDAPEKTTYNIKKDNQMPFDSMTITGPKSKSFNAEITHRYYINLLKNVSAKFYFSINIANSLGYAYIKSEPYNTAYTFPRKTNEIYSNFEVSYSGGYFINDRLLIAYRSTFLKVNMSFLKSFIDNPYLPEIQRKQALFNMQDRLTLGLIPKNITCSVAYKF